MGLSCLLTSALYAQRDVIQGLEETGYRSAVKVLVGGAATTAEWAHEIGADGYAADAASAVRKARQVLGLGDNRSSLSTPQRQEARQALAPRCA